jgi:subfamily B ATP-binding cassette protein MsbA
VARRDVYRRLLPFLRPHGWRMAGTVAGSVIAAALDGFAFALLIPFLNALFGSEPIPVDGGWVTAFLRRTVGELLDPANPMVSLRNVIVILLVTIGLKNFFVWFAGQLGVQLQEYVTRDLRDAVYRHLQRLPIGWFTRNKTGQILSRVLSDTAQTKQLITQIVTSAIQSAAVVLISGASRGDSPSSRSCSRPRSSSRCVRCWRDCAPATAGCTTTTGR